MSYRANSYLFSTGGSGKTDGLALELDLAVFTIVPQQFKNSATASGPVGLKGPEGTTQKLKKSDIKDVREF